MYLLAELQVSLYLLDVNLWIVGAGVVLVLAWAGSELYDRGVKRGKNSKDQ